MKNMKKLASLLLALVMVLSLAAPVFADEATYSITINNTAEDHIYEAYQIFVGKLSKNADNDAVDGTNAVLADIQWGAGISAEGQAALQTKYSVDSAAALAEKLNNGNVKDFATEVSKYLTTPTASDNSVSDGKYVIEGLAAGYYLVKDQNGSLNGDNDSYTSYILEVVENSTLNPKSSVPEVQKKVDDKNDSDNSEDAVEWEDSADHDIGDTVPFQLKATLANNVSAYDTYKIVFHDTLSKGLTYDEGSYKVYLGNDTETRTDVTRYFQINVGTYSETNGTKITFTCNDVTAFGATDSSVIVVEYTATLNENAVLGAAGNPNVVYLEYSNNPNWKPGYKDDDNNPETPDVPEGPGDSPTGNTPEDKVIVFTYKTVINKVDATGAALAGAEFKLEKYNKETDAWDEVAVVKNEAGTSFTFTGIDDGLYRLTETVTPAGYNTIAPIHFVVTAEHEVLADDPRLTELNATETNADGSDLAEGTVGSFTVTHDLQAGSLTSDVVNKSGVVLPETGGMGTTLFYAVGGILVLAAVVLLVTKRRMAV